MLTYKCYAKNGRSFYLNADSPEQARAMAGEICTSLATDVSHLVSFATRRQAVERLAFTA